MTSRRREGLEKSARLTRITHRVYDEMLIHCWEHVREVDCKKCNEIVEIWKKFDDEAGPLIEEIEKIKNEEFGPDTTK